MNSLDQWLADNVPNGEGRCHLRRRVHAQAKALGIKRGEVDEESIASIERSSTRLHYDPGLLE
ncbi:DUF768 domain-containing protein (plasmid) [Mesorhizobium loti]|uniref:DUF768 domain-containing protein n=1 Tax=Mesorhizobium jarvisii TaxID=1777867 RepID=A0A6M7TUU0_9HYPH|nr:DUF768 domain-containing protein [Mesorhizobium jarvisii]QKD13546.1 DUF768 domain-containing protein [Mesorhizobium loti]RJT29612.1 DUF768 domain-containing protein [Mesorhizobium jarvisii]